MKNSLCSWGHICQAYFWRAKHGKTMDQNAMIGSIAGDSCKLSALWKEGSLASQHGCWSNAKSHHIKSGHYAYIIFNQIYIYIYTPYVFLYLLYYSNIWWIYYSTIHHSSTSICILLIVFRYSEQVKDVNQLGRHGVVGAGAKPWVEAPEMGESSSILMGFF